MRGNKLDIESATLLAKTGTSKRVMLFGIKHDQTSADLSSSRLQPADAILIASDVTVSASLTQVLAFCSFAKSYPLFHYGAAMPLLLFSVVAGIGRQCTRS